MLDYDEPVKDYESYFKEQHERVVSDYFEQLLKQSGVDEQLNIKTIEELRVLETNTSKETKVRFWWKFARVSSIVIASISFLLLFAGAIYLLITLAGSLLFLFLKVNKEVKSHHEKVNSLTSERDAKAAEAWKQLAPLNILYDWELAQQLFQKTFPDVNLDSFLSHSRLDDLYNTYGLSNTFNDGRSVLFAQSGSLKENPFTIARFLQHWIGTKTYTGSIVIYWTEQVRNAQGQWVSVQRTQTLTASVTKPFPEYNTRTILIYGHEAAPNLSFSRTPSNLSGIEESMINNWKKGHAIKKIEKKARTQLKKGTGDLTVMSNREFEALFNATDRDHEIEFRLLFTPLAQQEMVNLMNDTTVGYGDNFSFSKYGSINLVEPGHLSQLKFDSDPRLFHTNDVKQARNFFNAYHTNYFKAMYFALAPLFTIPLYRDKRSVPLPKSASKPAGTSFWEHEAIANHMGQEHFKHPASVTQNLLKTQAGSDDGGNVTVKVTAHGYEGFPMTDYIPVYGGDGNWHQVPVHWVDYQPVSAESSIAVSIVQDPNKDEKETEKTKKGWEAFLGKHGLTPENAFVRGTLAGILLSRK